MPQDDLILELARFIERIAAIGRTGLAFKPHGYDAERYEDLLREAARIHAVLARDLTTDPDALFQRWRDDAGGGYDGYVTVGVGCGAIVFNQRDEILLIKRPSGAWWYPTGFCDIGESPAENAAREVREETGLIVTPQRLIGIIDSLKVGSAMRHLYSMLFYCRLDGGTITPHPLETLDVGFFPLGRLPEPLHGRDRKWIGLAREFHFEGRVEAYFDPL
ncbi:MAG TPA: NUDIX domain-containing protein [Candidatus Binataceae bacterium]|jgi:ADP-ribose pyrophosphatase YjhB (NUDIX family)|nr:NUDIX domain-containing protein [Candidatus Binataceae bacterium]